MVSTISLINRSKRKIARTPALADPKVMNPFQMRAPALSAILSNDFSSRRFSIEMLPAGMSGILLNCIKKVNIKFLRKQNKEIFK